MISPPTIKRISATAITTTMMPDLSLILLIKAIFFVLKGSQNNYINNQKQKDYC